jgi:hypothetical protein
MHSSRRTNKMAEGKCEHDFIKWQELDLGGDTSPNVHDLQYVGTCRKCGYDPTEHDRPAPPTETPSGEDAGMVEAARAIRYVKQEDAHGCGLAVLAMLTGQTYGQVKSDLLEMGCDRPDGFAERGIDFEVVNEYLRRKGYAITKMWANCPITKQPNSLVPFSELCYANVEQQSGNWHFIVIQGDGTILDPLDQSPKTLQSYNRVGSITAVHKLAAQTASLAARVEELETALKLAKVENNHNWQANDYAEELKAKLAIATEGLRHYADESKWPVFEGSSHWNGIRDWYDNDSQNGYDLAADCLKRVDGGGEMNLIAYEGQLELEEDDYCYDDDGEHCDFECPFSR